MYTYLPFYSQVTIIYLDSKVFHLQERIQPDSDSSSVISQLELFKPVTIEVLQTLKNMMKFNKQTKNKNDIYIYSFII